MLIVLIILLSLSVLILNVCIIIFSQPSLYLSLLLTTKLNQHLIFSKLYLDEFNTNATAWFLMWFVDMLK